MTATTKNERHITNNAGGALCGALVLSWEWTFEGLAHANRALEAGTALRPCRTCLATAEANTLGGQRITRRITED